MQSRIRPLRLFEVLTRNRQSALGFVYCLGAAENGHLHILEYLVERKYNKYVESACQYAAKPRPLTV